MSIWNSYHDEWLKRFFGKDRGIKWPKHGYFDDMLRDYDDMRKDMEKMFQDEFKDIETKAPKELVREYTTPDGAKVREVGPIVYGYSMTIGADGKPHVKEFGNVRPSASGTSPILSSEREPLVDISTNDKEIKVIVEMPGVKKENIKVNAYDSSVEISTDDPQRKYHEVINLPSEADIETASSKYNNGILEVVFNKKQQSKPKGKEVKVE
jgi:HSP20 family protein